MLGVALAALLYVMVTIMLTVLNISACMGLSMSGGVVSPSSTTGLRSISYVVILNYRMGPSGAPDSVLGSHLAHTIRLCGGNTTPIVLVDNSRNNGCCSRMGAVGDFTVSGNIPSGTIFVSRTNFSACRAICHTGRVFGTRGMVVIARGCRLCHTLCVTGTLKLRTCNISDSCRACLNRAGHRIHRVLTHYGSFIAAVCGPLPAILNSTVPVRGNGNSIAGSGWGVPSLMVWQKCFLYF